MMFLAGFLFLCSMVAMSASNNINHVKMESMIKRESLLKVAAPRPDYLHELVFATKQRNLDQLEKMVLARGTPGNPSFQKWMTFDEVADLTSNSEGSKEILEWLNMNGIHATWTSLGKDFIKASAPISLWEGLLQTKFHVWEDQALRNKVELHILSEDYSIPATLEPHVQAVFYTSQAPPVISKHSSQQNDKLAFESRLTVSDLEKSYRNYLREEVSKRNANGANIGEDSDSIGRRLASCASSGGKVTISFINCLYQISSNQGLQMLVQSCTFV